MLTRDEDFTHIARHSELRLWEDTSYPS
jgi:hypothetical protein